MYFSIFESWNRGDTLRVFQKKESTCYQRLWLKTLIGTLGMRRLQSSIGTIIRITAKEKKIMALKLWANSVKKEKSVQVSKWVGLLRHLDVQIFCDLWFWSWIGKFYFLSEYFLCSKQTNWHPRQIMSELDCKLHVLSHKKRK